MLDDEDVESLEIHQRRSAVPVPKSQACGHWHVIALLERASHFERLAPDEDHGKGRREHTAPKGQEHAESRVLPHQRAGFGERNLGAVRDRGRHRWDPLQGGERGSRRRCIPASSFALQDLIVQHGEGEALPVLRVALRPGHAIALGHALKPQSHESAGHGRGATAVAARHQEPRTFGQPLAHHRLSAHLEAASDTSSCRPRVWPRSPQ